MLLDLFEARDVLYRVEILGIRIIKYKLRFNVLNGDLIGLVKVDFLGVNFFCGLVVRHWHAI